MDGYESLWQAIDRRIGLKTRELARPYSARVAEVGTGANADRVRVQIPGEVADPDPAYASDPWHRLPWAPVYGAMPAVDDYVFTLVDFPGRRVITSGGGGTASTKIPEGFHVYLAADTTGPASNTNTKITFDTAIYDTDSRFSTANNRYTPLVAGEYEFKATVRVSGLADQSRIAFMLFKNGALDKYMAHQHSSTSASQVINVSGTAESAANGSTDYFELFISHTSTGTPTIVGTATSTWWTGNFKGTRT